VALASLFLLCLACVGIVGHGVWGGWGGITGGIVGGRWSGGVGRAMDDGLVGRSVGGGWGIKGRTTKLWAMAFGGDAALWCDMRCCWRVGGCALDDPKTQDLAFGGDTAVHLTRCVGGLWASMQQKHGLAGSGVWGGHGGAPGSVVRGEVAVRQTTWWRRYGRGGRAKNDVGVVGCSVWGQHGIAMGSVVGGKGLVQWAVLLGGGMRLWAVTSNNQQKLRERGGSSR
jgi:hypothetical protein